MDLSALAPSPDWIEIAAAFDDDDAIKTSIATVVAAITYSAAGLNGAVGVGAIYPQKRITITRSSSANAYSVSPFLVTGTNELGATITDSIAQPNDDGNDVLTSSKGFSTVVSIACPANASTAGALKFGIGDIRLDVPARGFEAGADGVYKLLNHLAVARSITLRNGDYRRLAVGGIDKTTAVFPFTLYR